MASYHNLNTFEEHLQDSGFAFTDREEKLAREFFERGIQHEKNFMDRDRNALINEIFESSYPPRPLETKNNHV